MYLIMMVPAYGAPQGVVPVEKECGYRWDTIYKHMGLGRGNPQSGMSRAPVPAFIYLHTPPALYCVIALRLCINSLSFLLSTIFYLQHCITVCYLRTILFNIIIIIRQPGFI